MSLSLIKYRQKINAKPLGKKLLADSYQLLALLPYFLLTALYSLVSIFFTSIKLASISLEFSSSINLRSVDRINWYSSSEAEPKATFKKYPNWESLPLPQPSAILVGIDAAERRIWLINPYVSYAGKLLVSLYTVKAILCDLLQTFKSLKSFITPFNLLVKANSCQLNAKSFNQVRHLKINSLQTF